MGLLPDDSAHVSYCQYGAYQGTSKVDIEVFWWFSIVLMYFVKGSLFHELYWKY